MAKQSHVVSGTLAFGSLTQHDVYNGQSTGKYYVTITMSDSEAAKLTNRGAKVKDYTREDGTVQKQKKFDSKFSVQVVDLDGNEVQGEIPFGSEVRVAYTTGEATPEHGLKCYLHKVRLVQLSESAVEEAEEF